MIEAKALFRYKGRSMWPGFQEGDLLEVSTATTNEIKRGDCVAFRIDNKEFVAHRVVSAKGYLTTRGDALPAIDKEIIQPEQVVGKVVCIYRLGRPIRVWDGFVGRIAGNFYHYAGRIDPHRTSRGGKLAMRIRNFMTPCLRLCRFTGATRVLKRTGEPDMTLWKFGDTTVGRQDPLTHEWLVIWPWNIILKHPDQP